MSGAKSTPAEFREALALFTSLDDPVEAKEIDELLTVTFHQGNETALRLIKDRTAIDSKAAQEILTAYARFQKVKAIFDERIKKAEKVLALLKKNEAAFTKFSSNAPEILHTMLNDIQASISRIKKIDIGIMTMKQIINDNGLVELARKELPLNLSINDNND